MLLSVTHSCYRMPKYPEGIFISMLQQYCMFLYNIHFNMTSFHLRIGILSKAISKIYLRFNTLGTSKEKHVKVRRRISKILFDMFDVDLRLKWNPETYFNMTQLFTKAPLETFPVKSRNPLHKRENIYTKGNMCHNVFLH